MSVDISDLIKAVFNCKDIADARAADLQRVIDVGGRVDPDLAYEQDRREERFKLLLDRYIDERIKIAVGSDQRTIHDVSRSPLDVGDCGSHVRPAAEKCYEMESELMPCPICGESCTSYREFAELPAKVQCDVMLCNYALESASRAEGIEQHNTLARRSEIGRLVEAIVAAEKPDTTFILNVKWVHEGSETLLDALRALAAELEVGDDNR